MCSKMKSKYVCWLILHVLACCAAVEGLKCFTCYHFDSSSDTDPAINKLPKDTACRDYDVKTMTSTECRQTPHGPSICVTIKGEAEVEKLGKVTKLSATFRRCVPSIAFPSLTCENTTDASIISSSFPVLQNHTVKFDGSICTCKGDNCNGQTTLHQEKVESLKCFTCFHFDSSSDTDPAINELPKDKACRDDDVNTMMSTECQQTSYGPARCVTVKGEAEVESDSKSGKVTKLSVTFRRCVQPIKCLSLTCENTTDESIISSFPVLQNCRVKFNGSICTCKGDHCNGQTTLFEAKAEKSGNITKLSATSRRCVLSILFPSLTCDNTTDDSSRPLESQVFLKAISIVRDFFVKAIRISSVPVLRNHTGKFDGSIRTCKGDNCNGQTTLVPVIMTSLFSLSLNIFV